MQFKTLIALGAIALLAGCATQPPEPLSARLEGKTPDQRREILRVACLNEAEWDLDQVAARQPLSRQHDFKHANTTMETRHLKRLCHALPTGAADEVAASCGQELAEHADPASPAGSAHLGRLRAICEAATGTKIGI